jgi:hypothetical protein
MQVTPGAVFRPLSAAQVSVPYLQHVGAPTRRLADAQNNDAAADATSSELIAVYVKLRVGSVLVPC